MISNYQIEDILTQGDGEISYLGRRRETGDEVVIRRFLLEELDEGGLVGEWRHFYEESILWMQQVRHAHLRSVLAGGVDPVDGIPSVIIERLPGESLLERDVLSEMDARLLVAQGIAVIDAVGQQGWDFISWAAADVLFSRDDQGVAFFTFCLSPRRLLLSERGSPLEGLCLLVETVLGWKGRPVPSDTYAGLAGWVRRYGSADCDFVEARKALAALNREDLPKPAMDPIRQVSSSRKAELTSQKGSGMGKVVFLSILLVVVSVGGWYFLKTSENGEISQVEKENDTAKAVTAGPVVKLEEISKKGVTLFDEHPKMKVATVVEIDGSLDLSHLEHQWVVLIGRVNRARKTKSDKNRYLEFVAKKRTGNPYIGFKVSDLSDEGEFSMEKLEALEGRRIAVIGRGKLKTKKKYLLIPLVDSADLVVLDE